MATEQAHALSPAHRAPAQPCLEEGQQADLERLARLAASALHVPIVAIGLAATAELQLLAGVGVPAGWPALLAFYRAGRPADEAVLIEQLRPADLPAGLAALVGRVGALIELPLLGADGALLGYLSVADRAPRMWQAAELQQAEDLAGLAAHAIGLGHEAQRLQQAETALRELEEWARIVSDTADDVLITIDATSQVVFVNRAVEQMFGYRIDELIGRSVTTLLPEHMRARHNRGMHRYHNTRQRKFSWRAVNTVGRHKDGHEIAIEISFGEYVEPNGSLFTAIIRDVTDRKRAEQSLLESQARLQLLNNIAISMTVGLSVKQVIERATQLVGEAYPDLHISYALVDSQWRVTMQHASRDQGRAPLFGRSLASLLSAASLSALQRGLAVMSPDLQREPCFAPGARPADDQVGALMIVPAPITAHSPVLLTGLLCVDAAQPYAWNANTIVTLKEAANYIGIAISDAYSRDERRRAERLLLKSEATNRALLNAIPDLIFRMNRSGVFLDVKAPREAGHSLPVGDYIGKHLHEVMPEAVAWETLGRIEQVLLTGEMQIYEYQMPTPGGGTVDYEARLVPCAEDEVMAIVRDITERKRLETQLLQIQKIESVGQLAGGIAHDFNNLLTAIIGYADLAMMSLPPAADALGDVEEIHRAAERAAGLTRQLLSFARWQVVELRLTRLNELIFDLYKLLRRLIGEDIELIILPSEQSAWARVDPGQIEQVLVNLAVNARDAMPDGGKLMIELDFCNFDEESARRHVDLAPGPYVRLSVTDTGVGMTNHVKAHLFEPFFTTKEKGRGTGLGLATCYGIVKQHGGAIEVASAVGAGTTIAIYLPRVQGDGDGVVSLADETNGLPRGKEIILLVEDEPAVRVLAARVLRAQGYIVFEAENGDEALSLVRQRGQAALHLLLTDVVMPRMSGKTLAERMTAMLPDLKILFTSGYTNDTMFYQGAVDAGIAFLQKPFTLATLARKVREVLDR